MKVTPTRKKEFQANKAIKVIHKHWIVYVSSIMLLFTSAWIFYVGLQLVTTSVDPAATSLIHLLGLIIIASSGILFALCLISIVFWFFNFYQITDEYVIHAKITPKAKFDLKEILITDISNVGQTRPGFISALLNFGTVNISLFNVKGALFKINLVKEPHKILTYLNQKINDKH